MDVRRLQRALFRMQHDRAFADALRAGECDAVASTGLADADVAALRALDSDAVAADREGRRAAQLLRNVTSEFALTLAALQAVGDATWIEGFPLSPSFHRAVSEGTPLPLAFGDFAAERCRDAAAAALLALERALAEARRRPDAAPAAGAHGFVLAPHVELVRLPGGTFAVATAWQSRTEGARAEVPGLREPAPGAPHDEVVLLVAGPRPAPYGLRAVRAEPLEPLVAAFLEAARSGLTPAGRRSFASRHEVAPAELEAVAKEFLTEGVLLEGDSSPSCE